MSDTTAPALPMTVIGGYLGAGKTTLINQLLQAPHGRRLMVMVNDFGAINIDAALLQSADEDTLTLTNGTSPRRSPRLRVKETSLTARKCSGRANSDLRGSG